ncbi:S8 family serine peptidase, partial [Candidatus Woesearchaeota archaeon]|nr:S8 family serine peptidase [Candidatus Woesearchaeota archaeon]
MVKLSTIFECFLGIVLIISVVLFTGGIIAHRSTIDAVPVVSLAVQTDLSSSVADEPETQTQQSQAAVSEPEPEPESMTFVSSYTPPVYNRGGRNKVSDNVQAQVDDSGSARVIVTLSDSGKKNEVLSQLKSFDKKVDMKYGFAGYVDEDDLGTLESNEFVLGVDEDRVLHAANAESFPLINADKASNASYNGFADLTGAGQTVCIIDTGVDYRHDDLGNCTGTQFLNGSCPTIIGGYDFYNGDDDSADDNGHGTSIAGIIAGNGPGYKGLAPDAKIVALKISDASGNAWESHLENAVDWCNDNASKYNITT